MIIALAGRRVDPTNPETARFPLDQADAVLDRVRSVLQGAGATALVGSGACGADLLAMQAAGDLGLRRRMILPFAPARFRADSVADRPGDWGPMFDRIAEELAASGDLIVLGLEDDPDAAYAATNGAILDEAQRLAKEQGAGVAAVVVWDGQSRGEGDLTADFARTARALGLPVTEVSTLAADPGPDRTKTHQGAAPMPEVTRKTLKDRLPADGQKKLLALDGGGIRGLLSIEFLAQIEESLRASTGRADLVLADYFDYIAGTSTGAIIAACLSLGKTVDEVRKFYVDQGAEMFDSDWLFRRPLQRYSDQGLQGMLKRVMGADTKLGSDALRTLLMVVLRNATTDSPWPLSNNPSAKYNDRALADCNLDLPLWQVVRASTAAPTFFPPEVVKVGPHEFIFVDGGVTVFNNPALQLYLMATLGAYKLGWRTGEDRMLLVSIGTGAAPDANANLKPGEMNLMYQASHIPAALMTAATVQQDFLCRALGRCRHGAPIDGEVGDLMGSPGEWATGTGKLFSYVRYEIDLTQKGIDDLVAKSRFQRGLPPMRAADVQQMDSVEHIKDLADLGRAAATRDFKVQHLDGFPA